MRLSLIEDRVGSSSGVRSENLPSETLGIAILCLLDRHAVDPASIGWIGSDEVGRCRRCACDLRKTGADWRRLPPGLKLVLRAPLPRDRTWGDEWPGPEAARQVDLHGVTVVGERTYGSRRYALVVIDEGNRRGFIAAPSETAARSSADIFPEDANDSFEWENTYARP